MDHEQSNKRLKSASGAPIKLHSNAANLPAYTPPAAPKLQNGSVIGPGSSQSSASIARPTNGKTSLRLTVKAPPSKLRQATSGSQIAAIPPNPYKDDVDVSESDATPQPPPAARAARATRNPRTVVEPESDEEEEEEDEQEDEEMRDETLQDEDSEEDADGEDEDEDEGEEEGDGDEDDEDIEEEEDDEIEDEDELQATHPPPPMIKQERPAGKIKPNVTVTAPPEGPMKSVEDKEMEDDDGEEDELSELDSNENDEEEDEEDDDSDGSENDISRSATPDLSKLTRRQRGAYEEAESGNLMALSNEAQKKKHLTAEEHAMRRAEMARRRKNLSEKRNEEEKMDTINKLLKKPAPKRRTRAEIIAQQHMESMATPGAEEGEEDRPDPLFVRWVNNREGSRIGVPEEWLEAPVGEIFLRPGGLSSGRMVEEVA